MAEARQWETASGKHQEEKAGKGSVFKLRERGDKGASARSGECRQGRICKLQRGAGYEREAKGGLNEAKGGRVLRLFGEYGKVFLSDSHSACRMVSGVYMGHRRAFHEKGGLMPPFLSGAGRGMPCLNGCFLFLGRDWQKVLAKSVGKKFLLKLKN